MSDDDESGDRANNSAIFDEKVAKNSETFVVLYMGKVTIAWSNELKKRYSISKESWRKLSESEKDEKFRKFLENIQKVENVVKSTFSNFMVQKCGVARKPDQKKRIKRCRTSGRR